MSTTTGDTRSSPAFRINTTRSYDSSQMSDTTGDTRSNLAFRINTTRSSQGTDRNCSRIWQDSRRDIRRFSQDCRLDRGSSYLGFRWPMDAPVLEGVRSTSQGLDSALEEKLKELGILRSKEGKQEQEQEQEQGQGQGQEQEQEVKQAKEKKQESLESAAKICGRSLPRRHVWLTFDNFLAKSRPGLESDEEVKEVSPKPKKNRNRRNNNNTKTKKKDGSLSWHDDKENKTIKTTGWDNPAWKTSYTRLIPPQSAGLIRAA